MHFVANAIDGVLAVGPSGLGAIGARQLHLLLGEIWAWSSLQNFPRLGGEVPLVHRRAVLAVVVAGFIVLAPHHGFLACRGNLVRYPAGPVAWTIVVASILRVRVVPRVGPDVRTRVARLLKRWSLRGLKRSSVKHDEQHASASKLQNSCHSESVRIRGEAARRRRVYLPNVEASCLTFYCSHRRKRGARFSEVVQAECRNAWCGCSVSSGAAMHQAIAVCWRPVSPPTSHLFVLTCATAYSLLIIPRRSDRRCDGRVKLYQVSERNRHPTHKSVIMNSHSCFLLVCFALVCLGSVFSDRASGQAGLPPFNNYVAAREQLIREILVPGGVTDERVLSSMRTTPRHEFVPQDVRAQAYYDRSLPIGASQTISSPFIVAIMTQELDTKPEHKVLEIGTGSGFQAAVLSPLVKEVYSIEIVPELGNRARQVLTSLGYKNVTTKVGDGYKGWEEYAPFDRIIVTCSPENVPQPLVDQLVEGGLMIIPVGERYQQMLYLMRKKDGKLEREALRPTLFVPMTGAAEDKRQVKADPANPSLVNGDFEEEPLESGDMPGWYYQSGLSWETEEGKHFVEFYNDARGRPTHLLQGVALDGRLVRRVRLAADMRLDDVVVGLERSELPAVTVRFYDEKRALLGTQWIGLVRGTKPWKNESRFFRVPADAREAIVSIGLFGATGRAAFDNVVLEAVKD